MYKFGSIIALGVLSACGPTIDSEPGAAHSSVATQTAEVLSWSVMVSTMTANYSSNGEIHEPGEGVLVYDDVDIHSVRGHLTGDFQTRLAGSVHTMEIEADLDALGVSDDRFSGPLSIAIDSDAYGYAFDFEGQLEGVDVDLSTSVANDLDMDGIFYAGTIDGQDVSGRIDPKAILDAPERNDDCRAPVGVDCD